MYCGCHTLGSFACEEDNGACGCSIQGAWLGIGRALTCATESQQVSLWWKDWLVGCGPRGRSVILNQFQPMILCVISQSPMR